MKSKKLSDNKSYLTFIQGRKAFVMSDAMIWLILGLIALLVIGYIVYPLITKSGIQAGEKFSLTKDCDNDGIENLIDKCPCDPGVRDAENPGCDPGQAATPWTNEQREKCNKEGTC